MFLNANNIIYNRNGQNNVGDALDDLYTSAGIISGSTDVFANLPDVSLNSGKLYLVLNGSGGALGFYKYPKGLYYSDGILWKLAQIQTNVSMDTNSLINITDWATYIVSEPSFNIGDWQGYNGIIYQNITGTYTNTTPDLDFTNWTLLLRFDNTGTSLISLTIENAIKELNDKKLDGGIPFGLYPTPIQSVEGEREFVDTGKYISDGSLFFFSVPSGSFSLARTFRSDSIKKIIPNTYNIISTIDNQSAGTIQMYIVLKQGTKSFQSDTVVVSASSTADYTNSIAIAESIDMNSEDMLIEYWINPTVSSPTVSLEYGPSSNSEIQLKELGELLFQRDSLGNIKPIVDGNNLDMGSGKLQDNNTLNPISVSDSQNTELTTDNKSSFVGSINEVDKYKSIPIAGFEYPAPTITDNGDGTIDIGEGYCWLYSDTNYNTKLTRFYMASVTGFSLNEGENFVHAFYNAGSPIYQNTSVKSLIDSGYRAPLVSIFKRGIDLHDITWDSVASGFANKIFRTLSITNRFTRLEGLGLTADASRVVTIEQGVVSQVLTIDIPLSTMNSSVNDWTFLYRDGGNNWVYDETTTTYNNTQYNPTGGGLTALLPGRWTVNWIFRGIESESHGYYVLGTENYLTLASAKLAKVPELPDILNFHGFLIGRIIVEQGSIAPIDGIESAFVESFAATPITNHNNLSGLNDGDYIHHTLTEYNNHGYLNTTNTWTQDNIFINTISGSIDGNSATTTALQTARNIAGQSFDGTADISIASTDLSDSTNIARKDTNNNFSTAQTITGTLTVVGDIVQNGSSYETHLEQLYTKKDIIITRDGAVGGLGINDYTGIQAKLYDGVNDGQLVFGADGYARVGDVGDLQILATRSDEPITQGHIAYWNDTSKRLDFKSELNFAISTATQNALDAKVDKTTTVNGQALSSNVLLDTDDISEGLSNLYYTEARVSANTDVSANTAHRGLTNNPHSVTLSQLGVNASTTAINSIDGGVSGAVAYSNTTDGIIFDSNFTRATDVATARYNLVSPDNNNTLTWGVQNTGGAFSQQGFIYANQAELDLGASGGSALLLGSSTNISKKDFYVNKTTSSTAEVKVESQSAGKSSLKLFESDSFGFELEYDGSGDRLNLWSRKFAGNEAIRMYWEKNGDVGLPGKFSTNVSGAGYIRGSAAGQLLNISSFTYDTTDVTVNSTVPIYTVVATASYTPVSNSSHLYIDYNTFYNMLNGNGADTFRARITVGGNEITYTRQEFNNNSGGGTRSGVLLPISGRYENSGTTPLTINIEAAWDVADDNVVFKRDSSSLLKVTEVAR